MSDVILLSSDSSSPIQPEINDECDDVLLVDEYKNSEESGFVSGVSSVYTNRPVHALSDSDDSIVNEPQKVYDLSDDDLPVVSLSDNCKKPKIVSKKKSNVEISPPVFKKHQPSPTKPRKYKQNELLESRKEQRAKAKEEKARAKAFRLAATETRKIYKPGECIKYVRVFFDQDLLLTEYGAGLLVSLQEAQIQYTIQPQVANLTISWTREVPEHYIDEKEGLQVKMELKEEEQILVIKSWDEIVNLVYTKELLINIESILSVLPQKKITLVIYGMENYFKFQKTQKNREVRSQVRGTDIASKNKRKDQQINSLPKIKRVMFEEAIVELELFLSCNVRCVETQQDFGSLVAQFTKAIAETPFKLERQRKELEKLDWFASADSKDCVPIDKHGNGLSRLWKQQLCQFDLATLDTAEAISSVFQSPQALAKAYAQCSSKKEAELLLRDIPIRRGIGPLTSVRRIGPELSKKIHVFFTAEDGEMQLSQE